MLVDALSLRRNGVPRSRAELGVSVPQRLTLTVERQVWARSIEIVAYLSEGPRAPPYLRETVLRNARLTRVRGDSFLLVGDEMDGRPPNQVLLPQVWWCRIVLDASKPPVAADLPVDAPAGETAEA